MATAFSYVRFSSAEQAKGDSLRRQLAASEKYANEHGLVLDTRTYQDLATSAFRGDNLTGKLGAFISAIDRGQIERGSYLLVESIDRLSRDQILKSLNLFTSILSRGIIIVTLSDNKVYTEDSINNLPDLIYSLMIMARAHEESALKGSRVADAWVEKRRRAIDSGDKLTHKIPSWLVLNNNHFTVNPEQAALVQRIFQMSIDGHGSMSIAQQLNEEEIPTWRRGNGWHPSHIRKLLHTPSVCGWFTPGKIVNKKRVLLEPIADYYPSIISQDTFYQAERAIKQRTSKGGRPGGTINLFAALLRCFHCDGPVVRLIRGRSVFVCNNGRRGYSKCKYSPWGIDEFERKVLTCVRRVDLSLIFGSEVNQQLAALHHQLVGTQGKLAEAEGRLVRLIELWEQGVHVASVAERINKLEVEIQTLKDCCALMENEQEIRREAMNTAESKQRSVVELMNVIHDKDVRLKLKQALRGLIQRIDVDLVDKQMAVFYVGQRMMPISPSLGHSVHP